MNNKRRMRTGKKAMHNRKVVMLSGVAAVSAIALVIGILIYLFISGKKVDEIASNNAKIGGWEAGFDPFYGAPVILIVLADKTVPTHVYDGSLVMGNLMNAAESIGVARSSPDTIKKSIARKKTDR